MEVKIVIISDTHTHTEGFEIPECDILIHAGDFTYKGAKNESLNFLAWFDSLRQARFKCFIAGNHEVLWDPAKTYDHTRPEWLVEALARYEHLNYLKHSSVELCGLNIFGSPYTPEFYPEYWAFNRKRGPRIASEWAQIPSNTDILVVHGPAKGTFDFVPAPGFYTQYPSGHVGCEDLQARIEELPQLKVFAAGHIHPGYGRKEVEMPDDRKVIYVNASIVNEDYKVANPPHVITLEV